jgi:hypothetical protein
MAGSNYTHSEVAWLLSLEHWEALEEDTTVPSVLRDSDSPPTSISADDQALPVLVRWHEVHHARKAVVTEKRDQDILRCRLAGETEEEVAERVKLDRSTVSRRLWAKIDKIVEVLGGAAPPNGVTAFPDMCIACGERRRTRVTDVRHGAHDLWRRVGEEHQLSVCARCLTPEQRRLVTVSDRDYALAGRPTKGELLRAKFKRERRAA